MATRRKITSAQAWVLARKISQGVFLLAFLALLIAAPLKKWPFDLINLPVRLDPLAMLAGLVASRTFLAGSALALITILATIIFGRAWCGWFCPLGTTLDLIPLRRKKEKFVPPSENWRRVKYSLLIAILSAALFTNLTLLVFDPLTIFIRTFSSSIWPALGQILTAAETALYRIPFLQDPISSMDSLLRPALFPIAPVLYRYTFLYASIFAGILLLNRLAPRFWCRYLCPLGALLGLVSKVSVFRRTVTADCRQCAVCQRECPVGAIRPEKGYTSDPTECIMCMDCQEDCSKKAISFRPVLKPAEWTAYDPNRRQALEVFGASLVGLAVLQADEITTHDSPFHILPPGGLESDLLAKCVRCGDCMRACPTNAIQLAVYEAGLEGFGTPTLVMRTGFCDYACNVCGQVCPTRAIPPLSLDEKRQRVIGKAYIDKNRCIAWADHRDCIVCEEMCPLPEKAIVLQTSQVTTAAGETVDVRLPEVLRAQCIGCGICEKRCPLTGDSAIRIYIPTA
jgi:polyferredoxin